MLNTLESSSFIVAISITNLCKSVNFFSTAEVRCNHLEEPKHGHMSCEQHPLTIGKKCYFKCHRGYVLEGSNERTCTSSKMWTGIETKCIRK